MNDQRALEDAIFVVNSGLTELINWSISHKDMKLDEIHEVKRRFEELAEELKK